MARKFNEADTGDTKNLLPPLQRTSTIWLTSSRILSFSSAILHLTLIMIHLILLCVWWRRLEHRLIIPMGSQTVVSLGITALATTFGTASRTLLRREKRKNLQRRQTLTATHDDAVAWEGIVSALVRVWHQNAVSASLVGALSAFLYLASILALHITTPALFSLETFNPTNLTYVDTRGFPALNLTLYSLSNDTDRLQAWDDIAQYAFGSLYFLPYIARTNNTGLYGETLYEVPNENVAGVGNISLVATGINVTCGYLEAVNVSLSHDGLYSATVGGNATYVLSSPEGFIGPGPIYAAQRDDAAPHGPEFIFWGNSSSTSLVDSSGNAAPPGTVDPSSNFGPFLRCSVSLVNQTAAMDAQSRQILSIEPDIVKNTSTWGPASTEIQGPQNGTDPLATPGISLVDLWESLYGFVPEDSTFGELISTECLNEQLTDWIGSDDPSTLHLHDLEHALANIVAAIFYTFGYVEPFGDDRLVRRRFTPSLLQGQTRVTQMSTQVRLDLSIIAIVAGLAASVMLALLSLQFWHLGAEAVREGGHASLDGTGLLHAIWLYRNHPELEGLLKQVDDPTEGNLRAAGMVRVRLLDRRLRKRRSWDYASIELEDTS
ncbi:hypothetical protein MSAN_00297100 [Mycena sanguinolenta]|uniref:Uncharacterized protein n=1 Tax=Mycena sanguinolenta TaxID=230812 RepID=A0A8H7DG38_9AGAR|nr:hypothetical protein MSAN_00297100 [Mycena sanguinolenta]